MNQKHNNDQGATVDRIIERDTPTDDERETLLSAIINAPESGDALHVAEAERVRDAILAAGFRRTEVPEPYFKPSETLLREIEERVYAEYQGVHGIGVALVRAGYEAGVKAR